MSKSKIKMPKNRKEFEQALMDAFEAGCSYGYGVEHTANIELQERIGAEHYIGKISTDEKDNKLLQVITEGYSYD